MTATTKLLIKLGLFSFFCIASFNNYASFLDEQLKYSRVRTAHQEKTPVIQEKLTSMDLELNNVNVLIKAYKYEQLVKIYVKNKADEDWSVYKTFPFNCTSGDLGPKRQEGDMQIPEGYYYINHFNPYSHFYLSLGVSYPNKADKIKSTAAKKGSAIYMHGGCASIGCIPIEDEPIKELYMLSVYAKNGGQGKIPLHIMPFEYSPEKMTQAIQLYPDHKDFWINLYTVEQNFDKTKILPDVGINSEGDYYEKE